MRTLTQQPVQKLDAGQKSSTDHQHHLECVKLIWATSELQLIQEAMCREEKGLLGLASPATQAANSRLQSLMPLQQAAVLYHGLPEPSATPACCCTHSLSQLHTLNRPAGEKEILCKLGCWHASQQRALENADRLAVRVLKPRQVELGT